MTCEYKKLHFVVLGNIHTRPSKSSLSTAYGQNHDYERYKNEGLCTQTKMNETPGPLKTEAAIFLPQNM